MTILESYQIYLSNSVTLMWHIKKQNNLRGTTEYKTYSKCGMEDVNLFSFVFHVYMTKKGYIDMALYAVLYY